jgi:hypothetical protein
MNAAAVLQVIILAVAGLACVTVVARKIAPASMRRLQVALAGFLHATRARPLRAFGAWLQPRAEQRGGCGSAGGSACSSCGACASPASPTDDARPLEFVRKAASRTR